MQDPFADTVEARKYVWDANGILIPVVSRFPSSANNAGFKPVADWVHSQGLKFGIHIVRGIPRQVVKENLPIANSNFHAVDAADTRSPCPWDQGNWGVSDTPAGQAYYDSMLKLYADWGLDYIKVDCISDHPYRPSEIRQIAEAIRKTGRPIVLSLSPGPTQLDHAVAVQKYAQLWRITDDHWDGWTFPHNPPTAEFPFGLRDEFDRIAKWAAFVKPGSWPDPDMLPLGWLGPHPGKDKERASNYTQDEQRTEFTLWAISRSPLILGTNLTKLDDFTRSLISNKEVLDINQNAVESKPGLTPYPTPGTKPFLQRYWFARTGGPHPKRYIAVFNLADSTTVSDAAVDGLSSRRQTARSLRHLESETDPQRKGSARSVASTWLRALSNRLKRVPHVSILRRGVMKLEDLTFFTCRKPQCEFKADLSSGSRFAAAPCPCQTIFPFASIITT